MSLQQNLKKPWHTAILLTSILIGGILVFVSLYSSKARELYADVWLMVFMPLFLLGLYIFNLITTWKKISKNRRIGLSIIMVVMVAVAYGNLSLGWQYLPWGRASAIETANNFMNDLKNSDYSSAFKKISPITQKNVHPKDLNQPNSQPVSWKLADINRDSVVSGVAIFTDGVELPVEIRLRWIDGNWKIYGVQFGEWKKDANGNFEITTRMDFMMCCDSYSFIFDTFFSMINGSSPFGYNQSP